MRYTPDHASAYLARLGTALAALDPRAVSAAAALLVDTYERNRTVFVCGNGGSASTASHVAADLGKNTVTTGRPRLRVMSLNDNGALLSALANDLGYERVFVEQMENLLQPDDLLIAISAGGNSPNILRAAEFARTHGAPVLGLVGFDGGRLHDLATVSVRVNATDYGPVEDAHLAIGHMLTEALRLRITNGR